jgi:hypothetical protein
MISPGAALTIASKASSACCSVAEAFAERDVASGVALQPERLARMIGIINKWRMGKFRSSENSKHQH